jgi:hypothetical protein
VYILIYNLKYYYFIILSVFYLFFLNVINVIIYVGIYQAIGYKEFREFYETIYERALINIDVVESNANM